MEQNIKAAITWLSDSEVLNTGRQRKCYGGVNNGYMWQEKTYQFVYNEITGYAINAFITMFNWTEDEKYLQHAKNAADYLLSCQGESNVKEKGAVCHGLSLPDLSVSRRYYTFDNAVILHGMINLYKITNERKYSDASLTIGNWLLTMQKENGSFCSYYDGEDGTIHHEYDEFFFDNGCLHVKNAIGLMHSKYLLNGDIYFQAGLQVCDWGKQLLSDSDGLFWANTRKKYVFTHAHCYATEGYLYAYHLSGDKKYFDIAKKAGDALLPLQNPDGSLFRIYKRKLSMRRWFGEKYRISLQDWSNERKLPWKTIDATAQAARIWILLYCLTNDDSYKIPAQKAIDFLIMNQVLDTSDPNKYGGLYYQRCDNTRRNETTLSSGMYTWCTQFALSAYMLFVSAQNKTKFDNLISMLY